MAKAVLVVLVIRDAGMRSMLTAQIAAAGAHLLTAEDAAELLARRLVRRPSLLVLDEADIEGDPLRWLERQWSHGEWSQVAVLTVESPAPASAQEWLHYLPRAQAAASVAALLRDWERVPPMPLDENRRNPL